MNIGALTMLLEADGSKLLPQIVKEAEKAGDAAGKKMGATMAGQFKSAAGLAVRGLGVALATLGTGQLLQLDKAMAEFRRETGATAAEAREAGKAINDLSGKNLQGIDEIGRAMAKVRTDLGVKDPFKLKEITQDVLTFARVTGQDAADAVLALDDILDNWGLTVDDAHMVLEKLVVSHQKFGGIVADNMKTLAQLAPALRAANFAVDDGIALLGLFGAKGLNAESAAAAFAKALTKVKSPAEFQALIDDIAATEDPFLRASKAADLFGAKAGAKLANALGGVHLDDFNISLDESADAMEKAGDAGLSMGDRIKLAVKGVTSALGELGLTDLGPLLLAVSGLASLGGGRFVKLFLAPFGGLGKKVTASVVEAILGAAVPAAAASEVVGEASANGWLAGFTGTRAGGLMSKATDKLGTFLGTGLGKAVSVAFLAVATVELVKTWTELQAGFKSQIDEMNKNLTDQMAKGTLEQLQQSRAAVAKALNDVSIFAMTSPIAAVFLGDQRKALENELAALDQSIAGFAERSAASATAQVAKVAAAAGAAASAAIRGQAEDVADAARGMVNGILPAVDHAMDMAVAAAASLPVNIAAAIRSKRSLVDAATALLHESLVNSKTPEGAKLIGLLTGDELVKGLKKKDPEAHNQALATKEIYLGRLRELVAEHGHLGTKAMEALNKAVHDKNPAVRHEAKAIKKLIEDGVVPDPTTTGDKTTDAIVSALDDGSTQIGSAANALGILIASELIRGIKGEAPAKTVKRGSSGAAQDPQDTRPASGGGNAGGFVKLAAGGPYEAGVPRMTGEAGRELDIPRLPGTVVPHAPTESIMRLLGAFTQISAPRIMTPSVSGASGPGGGDQHFHLNVQGDLRAQDKHDVLATMNRLRSIGGRGFSGGKG